MNTIWMTRDRKRGGSGAVPSFYKSSGYSRTGDGASGLSSNMRENMANNQGYRAMNVSNAYKRNTVSTASQGQLVVLLYEGAVKHLTAATALFGEDGKVAPYDIEALNDHLQKTQAIITELQVSLDMEAGGEIAQNLMSLYVYFNSELMSANINREKKRIDFVLKMMGDLLESWRAAAASTANSGLMPHNAATAPALNIKG